MPETNDTSFKLNHEKLINFINYFHEINEPGYQIDQDGLCFGISSMANQAMLNGDLEGFRSRLKKLSTLINNQNGNSIINILKQYNGYHDTKSFQRMLEPYEVDFYDLKAFFDGISLYLAPEQYGIFNKFYTQDQAVSEIHKIIQPTTSNNFEATTIHSFSGCYSQNEIKGYLTILTENINLHRQSLIEQGNHFIVFSLSSDDHNISLGYNLNNQCWNFVDANRLSLSHKDIAYLNTQDMDLLAGKLFTAFEPIKNTENNVDKKVGFSTKITCNSLDSVTTSSFIESLNNHGYWSALHDPNSILNKTISLSTLSYWLKLAVANGELNLITKLLNHKLINNNLNNLPKEIRINLLQDAVLNNHIEVIKNLITNKADINIQNESKHAALHIAVLFHNLEMTKELIQNKANINIQTKDGSTALLLAINKGHNDIANYLIDQGANYNIKNNEGNMALHTAVINNNLSIIQKLIKNKADINTKNTDGYTALFFAIANEHHEITNYLINNGANVNIQDNDGNTALHIAVINKNITSANQLIVKNIDINAKTKNGLTALHMAIINNDINMVNNFINHSKININITDKNGTTPLMTALKNGYIDIAQQLVSRGAVIKPDINQEGKTALHFAAILGNIDIIKKLIESKKININATDKEGLTALHLAAKYGHTEVVKKLISAGAKNNSVLISSQGKAIKSVKPIDLAFKTGNINTVKALLKTPKNK